MKQKGNKPKGQSRGSQTNSHQGKTTKPGRWRKNRVETARRSTENVLVLLRAKNVLHARTRTISKTFAEAKL